MLNILIFTFLSTTTFTYAYVVFQRKKQSFDIPNARSSHSEPTVSSGGRIFCGVISLYLLYAVINSNFPALAFVALIALYIIGWVDDVRHCSVKLRLGTHLVCSCLVLYSFYPNNLMVNDFTSIVLVMFFLGSMVWLINLYNFMDGINGIASFELITSVFTAIILFGCITQLGTDEKITRLAVVVIASSSGFLVWNFPRAKVFMGDVGSGFIGLLMSVFILASMQVSLHYFWVWGILLGVFVVDTTMTLFVRFFNGENVTEAHCQHAYQHAAKQYGQVKVVCVTMLINLFWLAFCAYTVAIGIMHGAIGIILAYVPLVLLAYKFRAGMVKTK